MARSINDRQANARQDATRAQLRHQESRPESQGAIASANGHALIACFQGRSPSTSQYRIHRMYIAHTIRLHSKGNPSEREGQWHHHGRIPRITNSQHLMRNHRIPEITYLSIHKIGCKEAYTSYFRKASSQKQISPIPNGAQP